MVAKLTDKTTASPDNKTTTSPDNKTIGLIAGDPLGLKTITTGHGTPFYPYKKSETCGKTPFYFANPYHSWE
jgi:IS30 family transposase